MHDSEEAPESRNCLLIILGSITLKNHDCPWLDYLQGNKCFGIQIWDIYQYKI